MPTPPKSSTKVWPSSVGARFSKRTPGRQCRRRKNHRDLVFVRGRARIGAGSAAPPGSAATRKRPSGAPRPRASGLPRPAGATRSPGRRRRPRRSPARVPDRSKFAKISPRCSGARPLHAAEKTHLDVWVPHRCSRRARSTGRCRSIASRASRRRRVDRPSGSGGRAVLRSGSAAASRASGRPKPAEAASRSNAWWRTGH